MSETYNKILKTNFYCNGGQPVSMFPLHTGTPYYSALILIIDKQMDRVSEGHITMDR